MKKMIATKLNAEKIMVMSVTITKLAYESSDSLRRFIPAVRVVWVRVSVS